MKGELMQELDVTATYNAGFRHRTYSSVAQRACHHSVGEANDVDTDFEVLDRSTTSLEAHDRTRCSGRMPGGSND